MAIAQVRGHVSAEDKTDRSARGWTVKEAAFIGLAGLSLYLTLSFLSTWVIAHHDSLLPLNGYKEREIITFVSLAGTVLILRPLVSRILTRRRLGGWWNSIDWHGKAYVLQSIAVGAVLAFTWSSALALIRGTKGFFGGPHLVSNTILYILIEVVLSSAVEEMYFRGILFVAFVRRFGSLVAVIVTTLAFDLIHVGHWLDVLPVAVILGITRLKTKSVASCFALHAFYNLFVLVYLLAARFRTG